MIVPSKSGMRIDIHELIKKITLISIGEAGYINTSIGRFPRNKEI